MIPGLPTQSPQVPQAAPNSGPAVSPQAHPGQIAVAGQKIHIAAKAISEALPAAPMGSEIHTELLKIATQLNKLIEKIPNLPGLQATALTQQARQVAANAPQAILGGMFPPGGGAPGGAPAGGPPIPPQPALPTL